jgi:molybdopterin-guanine dinucleotide biosynthesis protein A
LLHCALLDDLEDYLKAGERKIDRWYARHRMAVADFSASPDLFANVNTPSQRDMLAAQLDKADHW